MKKGQRPGHVNKREKKNFTKSQQGALALCSNFKDVAVVLLREPPHINIVRCYLTTLLVRLVETVEAHRGCTHNLSLRQRADLLARQECPRCSQTYCLLWRLFKYCCRLNLHLPLATQVWNR